MWKSCEYSLLVYTYLHSVSQKNIFLTDSLINLEMIFALNKNFEISIVSYLQAIENVFCKFYGIKN